ncbi:tigger transposable element-derived protein 6-like protein [Plakobranchus ocellatus]|uniref:Tigger transposable element-derived protein 6-like protein n=1 Tax=Plakobranchus ocellatus TaxID=259542 RepID=A0AAV4C2V5_9GAST|nr:tigger transposable element-derived protein 6-like protein [Plakobranchus ocellatus]
MPWFFTLIFPALDFIRPVFGAIPLRIVISGFAATDESTQVSAVNWLKGFKSRHSQLSIRTPEPTSIARETAFNKTNVGPFFDKLKQLHEELSLTPERIYNVDETALSASQKPQKMVAESRVKQVVQLVSHERGETITMLGIINAIGNSLPPCLVFPRKQFNPHMILVLLLVPHGFANPSGWM